VCFFLVLTAVWLRGGFGPLRDGLLSAPPGIVCLTAALQSLTNMGFATSLIFVAPARALILISLSPLWAALLGALLGEKIDRATMYALGCAAASVALVFAPSLLGLVDDSESAGRPAQQQRRSESASLLDVLPLATGVVMAAYVVSTRRLLQRGPGASGPVIPALGTAISLVFFLCVALWSREPTLLPPLTVGNAVAFGFNGVSLALLNSGITAAADEIAPAETAIILLLEAVLAPVWMLVWFNEVPSPFTVAGGVLLVGTLVAKELVGGPPVAGKRYKAKVFDLSPSEASSVEFTSCLRSHAASASGRFS